MINHHPDGRIRINATLTAEQLFELARETAAIYAVTKPELTSPGKVRNYLRAALTPTTAVSEAFHVLYMDTQNRLIAHETPFFGTVDACAVYPRDIVRRALELNAAAIIFAHNHPSGNPEPSGADRAITQRLKDALNLVGTRVLDHIVVGETSEVSLAERGWI